MSEKTPMPVGRLRERQKTETFKLILESARALFNELGFKKTTMRGVAIKAEIGLGTIYKYFSQKNAILAAAFYDDINTIMEEAFRSLSENLSLKEKLLYLANQFYTFYAIKPSLSKTYLTQMFQLDGQWLKQISNLDEEFLSRVAIQIDEAKEMGEVRERADSPLVAKAFFSHYL